MNERDGASPPHWGVDFWIADADAVAEAAAAMGGSGVASLFVVPDFRRAVSAGPQGAAFTVSRLVVAARGA